jgi:GntP family gluconate:H+ symporter
MWLLILLLLAIIFIIVSTTRLKLHPFLALLISAFAYGIFCGRMSLEEVIESVNAGFGATIGYIGIVILAGAVIGTFLERSGGAYKLAESTIKLVGEKHVPLAMGIIGYIVSIPVFCDSAFVILFPLSRALSRKARISLAASAIALSFGLYSTHTMVPPRRARLLQRGCLVLILVLLSFGVLW